MNTIIIEKSKLLPIVQENKKKHDEIYNTAVEGYWEKAEEVLKEKLAKVQKKEEINNYLNLTYPENHADDYDRVIRMLELSAEDMIELNSREFDSYVRNQWEWRQSFLTTNLSYHKKALLTNGEMVINKQALDSF